MNTVVYYGLWLIAWLTSLLPLRLIRLVGITFGEIGYWLTPRDRGWAHQNLQSAFPQLPRSSHRRIVRGAYHSLGMLSFEATALAFWSKDKLLRHTRIEGLEHLARAQAKGKGVVVLFGHTGNWEWLLQGMALMGHPVVFIYRGLKPKGLDRLVYEIRSRLGNTPVERKGGIPPILSAVKKGNNVALIMDQCAPIESGLFVPFFRHTACSHSTPGTLQRRTGAAVVPVNCMRDASGFVLKIAPEQPYPADSSSEDWLRQATAMDQAAIEEMVLQRPNQWLWMHRRYKVTPDGKESFYH